MFYVKGNTFYEPQSVLEVQARSVIELFGDDGAYFERFVPEQHDPQYPANRIVHSVYLRFDKGFEQVADCTNPEAAELLMCALSSQYHVPFDNDLITNREVECLHEYNNT